MTIQSSGAISLSDIRAEYQGGSGAISMGNMYRGGANVRGNASDNPSVNLSANVPTSGAIAFNNFYSQEKGFQYTLTGNQSNWQVSAGFGSDFAVNYPKKYIVNAGVTVDTGTSADGTALNVASNLAGSLNITLNGTARCYSGYCLRNLSSTTVTVDGSGSILKNNKETLADEWLDGAGTAQVNFIGGFGGASGSDIRHSDYGGSGFNCKVTLSSGVWTASWTYNECDYYNLGAGSTNISSIFTDDASNGFQTESLINTTVGSYSRDQRDIAIGRKLVNGVPEIWFASNNKNTTMTLGSTMNYSQPGHVTISLNTSDSRRSTFFQTKLGNYNGGPFSISGPSLGTG